jgi:hypothetical protein
MFTSRWANDYYARVIKCIEVWRKFRDAIEVGKTLVSAVAIRVRAVSWRAEAEAGAKKIKRDGRKVRQVRRKTGDFMQTKCGCEKLAGGKTMKDQLRWLG